MYSEKHASRILYGSDYYMLASQKDEITYFSDLYHFLTDEKFNTISIDNSKKFFKTGEI